MKCQSGRMNSNNFPSLTTALHDDWITTGLLLFRPLAAHRGSLVLPPCPQLQRGGILDDTQWGELPMLHYSPVPKEPKANYTALSHPPTTPERTRSWPLTLQISKVLCHTTQCSLLMFCLLPGHNPIISEIAGYKGVFLRENNTFP